MPVPVSDVDITEGVELKINGMSFPELSLESSSFEMFLKATGVSF